MDLGSLSVSACVMMACLLGAALVSSGDTLNCTCPPIPVMDLTKPPQEDCYQSQNDYRYQCVDGYLRKVGTSNLAKCRPDKNGDLHWSVPSLKCIPDPKRPIPPPPPPTPPPPTPPPSTTATTATPTSRQTTWNMSVSEDGDSDGMESATHGEDDSEIQTTAKAGPMQSSTVSPNNANSSTTSLPGANKGKADSVTQEIQSSTVSQSNANSSTTTSPGVHKETPTSPQTTDTVNSFDSVTGQRHNMKPTPHGEIDSVTQNIVNSRTRTSTISPSTVNSDTIATPGAVKGGEIAQAVGISASLVICAVIGIGISFLLYRRKSKTNIPLPTEEELRPMNCA